MPFSFKSKDSGGGDSKAGDVMSYVGRAKGKGADAIGILLTVVFIACLITAGGLFAYKIYLEGQINAKQARIDQKDKDIQSILSGVSIDELKSVSVRLKVLGDMVNNKTYVTSAFDILERSIEDNITLKNFSIASTDAGKKYVVDISGNAPDYHSVIQQIDTFNRAPYSNFISEVEVKSVHPNSTGSIDFAVHMAIAVKNRSEDVDAYFESSTVNSSNSTFQGSPVNQQSNSAVNPTSQ